MDNQRAGGAYVHASSAADHVVEETGAAAFDDSYCAEQQQDGGDDYNYYAPQDDSSSASYDPDTGAYYYNSDGSALQLEIASGAQASDSEYVSNYQYDPSGDGGGYYEGYEWDEASGQYTQSPSAFAFNDDDAGDGEDGYEAAPPSPFKDEAYWDQELYNYDSAAADAVESSNNEPSDPARNANEHDEAANAADAQSQAALADPSLTLQDTGDPPVAGALSTSQTPKSSTRSKTSSSAHKKKPKSKKERVQMRQELLEKEEEDKVQQQEQERSASGTAASAKGAAPSSVHSAPRKPPTFLEREKAKIHLQIRKARAMARKRMPVQVRILTQPRQHLSPLEKYFGSRSVDAALSDIFWAALKGDVRRVRYLVEVESASASDSKLDPWNMQQTPLHWAAKGGSREVVEYLISAGASVRSLDENGSLPLHLACWAGHIDATLALLRASDTRDLYVQDYDAALAPLDWARLRGHSQLLRAIEKYEDSLWLPKFIDDLIRGIVKYKIKLFKPPPKPTKLALAVAAAQAELLKTSAPLAAAAAAAADHATVAAPAVASTTALGASASSSEPSSSAIAK